MHTIKDIDLSTADLRNTDYNYQPGLTAKLDQLNNDFDQEIINEIVLWKVNRYACIDNDTLQLINSIGKDDTEINEELTKSILRNLVCKQQKGFRLAMASTILRFKNPCIYQIIDQRVYRFLYGANLNSISSNIKEQIKLYLNYLLKLKEVCVQHSINFKVADRIFYSLDKKFNSDEKLKW